jgi:signal transduction histidine kinase
MDTSVNCALAGALAGELQRSRDELTRRWLDRIAARVAMDPHRIFPSADLLNHVPVLIEGIAEYLEDPADEITADILVISKALELGALRHEQGFDAHEILKEYEILGGVLYSFLARVVDGIEEPCTRGELLECAQRLFRAISVIQQVTTMQYLALAQERVGEREERLRSFNRTVSHEMKNRIGAVLGAAQMLTEDWIRDDPAQMQRFVQITLDNAEAMQGILEDLLALSRTDSDARQQRHVLLPEAVGEVVRQLRAMAEAAGVEVLVRPDLPGVEVNAAALELCLGNYLSNAIKYSDPDAAPRWVEVAARTRVEDGLQLLEIRVRDNGIGVPPAERERIFERFYRAGEAEARSIEGTGLGLSIVREAVEGLGGRAWAEFDPGPGSTFCISLPMRRGVEGA